MDGAARGSDDVLVGIDTGGTFTDVALLDPASGRLWIAKIASTPEDPSVGFGRSLAHGMETAGVGGGRVGRVLHGTTVATNLILEHKGPDVALFVTAGFRYVLEIGRHDIPKRSNLYTWAKPPRPATPQNIWELPGRIDHLGRIVDALDEAAVRSAARELGARGLKTVAVSLLHSYANPVHERRVGELIRDECPDVLVSLSCDVLPVFREYERTLTTVLNAYVMPSVSSYVGRLEDRARDCGIGAPMLLMKSSGGVTSTRMARRNPVETALSGPAAGAVGAAFVASSSGFSDLITVDIGGTSADIGLIQRGNPRLTSVGWIGDWRVGLPMVDIMTIGAGGGSIARVTQAGALVVGPESAGARPGPVCYGGGGVQPTVSDAHLVLGHLPPYLVGGSLRLDVDAARAAIARDIAGPLGLGIDAAARGIIDVANHHMTGTIRVVSVERGFDPRDLVLVPFGGAGPLHGCDLAALIGCATVLVPPAPGVLSALGLLFANLRAEFARTCTQKAGRYDSRQLAAVFAELGHEALKWFDAEGVPEHARRLLMQASLRYKDQGFELDVPWAGSGVDDPALAATIQAFHATHEKLYGFALTDMPVEVVTLRVDAVGLVPPVSLPEVPERGPASDAIVASQRIVFPAGSFEVPLYERSKLGAGARIDGPAVITQVDATTLLPPGSVADVDRFGSLIVRAVCS